MDALAGHAAALRGVGSDFAATGQRINSTWQGLGGVYHAPEAGQLLAATAPVQTISASVGGDLGTVAGALASYAAEVRQIQAALAALRSQAGEFVASVAGDDDWTSDGDKVDRNNHLVGAVNAQMAAFFDAQRRCANVINALYGGPQYRADNGDEQLRDGEYGYADEALNAAAGQDGALPWGRTEQKDRGLLGDVGAFFGGVTDAAVGFVTGLGALIGRDPATGEWSWATAGTAWKGLGTLVLAAGVYAVPGGMHLDQAIGIPGFERGQLGNTLMSAGKAIIAYDEWGKDPARAAGMTTFNVVSAVLGTKGAGAGLRSAGAAAQGSRVAAVSTAGTVMVRAGEAIGKLPTVSDLARSVGQRIPGLHLPNLAGSSHATIPHHTDIPTPRSPVDLPTGHPRFDLPEATPRPGSVGDALSHTPRTSIDLPESTPHPGLPDYHPDARTPHPDAHTLPTHHAEIPHQRATEAIPDQAPLDATPDGNRAPDSPTAGDVSGHREPPTNGHSERVDYQGNPDFRSSDADRDTFRDSYAGYADDAEFVRDLHVHDPNLSAVEEEELVAIRGYTSNEFYAAMNEGLRRGDPALLQQYDSHIRTLTSGLNQLPAYEGVVGRGITVDPAALQNLVSRYEPGQVVREPSFVSTDTRAAFPGNIQFDIYSRTGRNISEFSHFPGRESEVLFPPGSTFKVLERAFDPASGTWYIRMVQDS